MSAPAVHPCQTCGACCASERVQFHRHHVTPQGDVPRQLVVASATPQHVHMRGTEEGPPRRCVALAGLLGRNVTCTIYDRRPPPCRDFEASFEDGTLAPECDSARHAHGMAPLTPADWAAYRSAGVVLDNS